ncbi:hypothetical protein ADUPG1_009554 [Aduncisulcus paluster]|uniref:Centrosomin N-terminal motif 1 domain-containing protein n=1 Tax=Aduncisulcus paluster TaxID=2918883 RepID=A0ABQ5KYS3_9EUKA|nr:hypothetical protein ADUPG1_009554 [Aduncisulcus paluster]
MDKSLYSSFSKSTSSLLADHLRRPASFKSPPLSYSALEEKKEEDGEKHHFESFKDLKEKVTTLERENLNFKIRIFELENALSEATGQDIDDITSSFDRSVSMAKIVADEIKEQTFDRSVSMAKIVADEIKEQTSMTRSQITEMKTKNQTMSQELGFIQKENEMYKIELESIQKNYDELESKHKISNNSLKEQENTILELKTKLHSKTMEYDLIKEQFDAAYKQISQIKEEKHAIEMKMTSQQSSASKYEESLKEMIAKTAKLEQENIIIEAKYEAVTKDLEDSQHLLSQQKDYFESNEKLLFEYRSQIAEQKSTIHKLSLQLEDVNQRLRGHYQSATSEQLQISSLEKTIKSLKDQIDCLQKQNTQLKLDLEKCSEDQKKKEEKDLFGHEQFQRISEKCDDLEIKYSTIKIENEKLRGQLMRGDALGVSSEKMRQKESLIQYVTQQRDRLKDIATKYKQKIESLGVRLKEAYSLQKQAATAAEAWKTQVQAMGNHISSVIREERSSNPCCILLASRIQSVVASYIA